MRALVQEPRKTRSILICFDGRAGLEVHVLEGALEGFLVGFGGWRRRATGTVPSTPVTMPGEVPQVTVGVMVDGVDVEFAIEDCSCIGDKCRTSARRPRPMLRLAARSGGL